MSWVAPVALAVVFAFAGGAKFADLPATTAGFTALDLKRPERLAVRVPAAELATAVLLIAAPVGGAIVALILLLTFTTVLVMRLRSGARVPCKCFGGVRTRPIAWTDVLRNLGLATLAVVTLAIPPP